MSLIRRYSWNLSVVDTWGPHVNVYMLLSAPQVQPPLIPPRGEVNAADAFDIGNFDDDDTRGIKVSLDPHTLETTQMQALLGPKKSVLIRGGVLILGMRLYIFLLHCGQAKCPD